MNLLIDTTVSGQIFIALLDKSRKVVNVRKRKIDQVSENLLFEIAQLLKFKKVHLKDLSGILVNPGPGAFSSVRTGVATANALAYALGVPVACWPSGKNKGIVLPKYDKEPNITRPKKY